MKEKSINLGQCIIDCNGEQTCEQSCVNMFKVQYDQCPCQVETKAIIEHLKHTDFGWIVFQNDGFNYYLRRIVRLDVHANLSIVNRIKNQS